MLTYKSAKFQMSVAAEALTMTWNACVAWAPAQTTLEDFTACLLASADAVIIASLFKASGIAETSYTLNEHIVDTQAS